uniref:Putative secreted protein n=1 Tax=Amblyomma americanum TaxID=6943 RepID=A0A0C9R6C0_AMBAM
MIFNLALCFGVIAASAAEEPMDGALKSKDLDIRDVINVTERLVVIRRKHTIVTHLRCHSALKMGGGNDTSGYIYLLKARSGTNSSAAYVHSIVNVTLLPLNGSEGYKATYLDGENKSWTRYNLTLKQKDSNEGCFVILVEKSTGQAGCELVVPVSKRNIKIPETCENYYTHNCTGTSLELYEPTCRYDKLDTNHNDSAANTTVIGC